MKTSPEISVKCVELKLKRTAKQRQKKEGKKKRTNNKMHQQWRCWRRCRRKPNKTRQNETTAPSCITTPTTTTQRITETWRKRNAYEREHIYVAVKYSIYIVWNGVPLTYWYTDTEQHRAIARSWCRNSSCLVFLFHSYEKAFVNGVRMVRCAHIHMYALLLFCSERFLFFVVWFACVRSLFLCGMHLK